MAIVITTDATFRKLNDDPSYSIKPGGLGREREVIVNVAIGSSDNYVTGGITLDFSSIGLNFTQVYLCEVLRGHGGLLHEFVPAVKNAAATGKLKLYGNGAGATSAVAATGTFVLTSAVATDTVVVNGLTYTGVAGVKSDDTEFSIDTSDTAAALDLADSIDDDTRVGTFPVDVTATSSTNTVTMVATQLGIVGNQVDTVSGQGTIVAGAATLTGGLDGDVGAFAELDSADSIINSKTLVCKIRGI